MRSLSLTFALLLVTVSLSVASLYQMSPLDYLNQLAGSECTQAGSYVCSDDCSAVYVCVASGEGLQKVMLETCSDDTKCSSQEGKCVTDSTCRLSGGNPISCHAKAIFPDPYNCTVYHICVQANSYSIPKACAEGHAYNPLTSDCSCQTTDSVCEDGPVPACTDVGDTGALATNPSIYYICVDDGGTLVPDLYKCLYGLVYDPATFSCVNSTSPTASTGSSGPTTPTTTTSSSSEDPPTPGGYCSDPLVIVADPEECTSYYECGPGHTWLHMNCILGYHFNPETCEIGAC